MNLRTRLTKLEKIFPPRGRSKSELFAELDKLTFPQLPSWGKGLKTQEERNLYNEFFEEFDTVIGRFQSKLPKLSGDELATCSEVEIQDLFNETTLGELLEFWTNHVPE